MLKVGIIGAGRMGEIHADCYSKIPEVELKGIASKTFESAKALAEKYSAKPYRSPQDLIADRTIDLIDICVPTPFHKDFVLKSAAEGKNIFCEAPLARYKEDAQEMLSACDRSGVKFMVGQVLRFFPEYAKIKKLIEQDAIGKPGVIRASRLAAHPQGRGSWYADYEATGGVIVELMIHEFDFLRWCFGEIERVYTKGLMTKKLDRIDYALTTLRFKSGSIAHVNGSWAHTGGLRQKLEIAGDKGLIDYDSQRSESLNVSIKGKEPERTISESPLMESPYLVELRHFVQCIQQNESPAVTPQDAFKALEISLAALESAKTGKPVTLST